MKMRIKSGYWLHLNTLYGLTKKNIIKRHTDSSVMNTIHLINIAKISLPQILRFVDTFFNMAVHFQ